MDRTKLFTLVLLYLLHMNSAFAQDTLYLGVLAHQGNKRAVEKWYPLTEYLNNNLSKHLITIVPVNLKDLESMVSRGRLDFILTNSGHYVNLREKFPMQALASLRNKGNGQSLDHFGSVLFTQRGRSDIRSFQDLQGKTLAAVSRQAFGGFQTVIHEMRQQGMQPLKTINMVYLGFPQDQIAQFVALGKVDAGIVRTGVLESLHESGVLDLAVFNIINPQQSAGFPFLHSTKLYPEWPFVAMQKVSKEVQHIVQRALLDMPADHPAAIQGQFRGWSEIRDYSPVKQVVIAYAQAKELENWYWQLKVWISHKKFWIIYSLLASIVCLMLYILRHDISHRYSHR